MDIVLLETIPKIAVYSPPGKQPWDDAVTLALTYAEVNYDVIFDEEVLSGLLTKYDWLHLHHEDFTGQYGKFYKNYRNRDWYQEMESEFNFTANQFGFQSVHELKKNVAYEIKKYIESNSDIKTRVISSNNDYTSIMIRPKLNINMADLVNSIMPLSESILKDFDPNVFYNQDPYNYYIK